MLNVKLCEFLYGDYDFFLYLKHICPNVSRTVSSCAQQTEVKERALSLIPSSFWVVGVFQGTTPSGDELHHVSLSI